MFLTGVSFFGLFLVGVLALNPPAMKDSFVWRKPLVGSLFGSICIFGIMAVFLPRQCSAMFDFSQKEKHEHTGKSRFDFHGTVSMTHGHHPDCEKFSDHVFWIKGRRFCAACAGLFLGGLVSLVGASLYFFGGWHIKQISFQVVLVGILGIIGGLIQFKVKTNFVRLFLNTVFVLGAFLLLSGIDELAQNVFADLFLVILVVFWLFTRISLSQRNNWRICYTCNVASCKFRRSAKRD